MALKTYVHTKIYKQMFITAFPLIAKTGSKHSVPNRYMGKKTLLQPHNEELVTNLKK